MTLHDLRVHLEAALDDYENFVRRGARVGEIAADETDVEDEADPSGCNAMPSDDVDLGEPGPSNRKMAEYHDWLVNRNQLIGSNQSVAPPTAAHLLFVRRCAPQWGVNLPRLNSFLGSDAP